MLRAIADLDPRDGQVFLDDTECMSVDAPLWRTWVGMLPAESQWWYDTVGEHFNGVDPERLAALGLDENVMKWTISRLSTGERQRLALVRLLGNQPRALLLDEPTAGLDTANVQQMEVLIAAYRRQMGAPVLWVSHDPDQVGRLASRRYELVQGGNLVRAL